MAITGCQLQNVTANRELDVRELRQAGGMVDLDYRRSSSIVQKQARLSSGA